MIILIAGSTHTGKTNFAQKLLEKTKFPYLSIDHLKMGLIRSKNTLLEVTNDEALIPYLWNIVKEIIKTALENKQNLIIEGCYIPFSWKKDFSKEELKQIHYHCLIFTEYYIKTHFEDILYFEDCIEKRKTSDLEMDFLIHENKNNLGLCQQYHLDYFLFEKNYDLDSLWNSQYLAYLKEYLS